MYFNSLKFLSKRNKGLEYNKLHIENNIAECMMIHLDNWEKIRGGRYTRFDIKYHRPINKYLERVPKYNSDKFELLIIKAIMALINKTKPLAASNLKNHLNGEAI